MLNIQQLTLGGEIDLASKSVAYLNNYKKYCLHNIAIWQDELRTVENAALTKQFVSDAQQIKSGNVTLTIIKD